MDDWANAERYIAIDWGTTRRRAYLLDSGGGVLNEIADDRGAATLSAPEYPVAFAELRARFGSWPIVAAGMIGARSGWREAPYVAAPATLGLLASNAIHCGDLGVTILPGITIADGARHDVMRGEEIQVLGSIAASLAPLDAVFCQPGTHNKWMRAADGAIAGFTTVMTGELFALLRSGGTLAPFLGGPVHDGPAFRDGVARGLDCPDLGAILFEARAAALLGARAEAEIAALVSGMLIGADVGIGLPDGGPRHVHMLASGALGTLYAATIGIAGGTVAAIDSSQAFVAGIHAMRSAR